jgi:uncharacterized protein (TIGR03435 family)
LKTKQLTVALLLNAGLSFAQADFEVASIRPHPGVVTVSSNNINSATYRGVAINLMDLVKDAYGVQYNQVSGGPGWVTSEHFDVEAKAGGGRPLTEERARPILQTLLEQRFKLKVHREAKEVPAFDLVIAKGGAKFKENTDPNVQHPGMAMYVDASGAHYKSTKAPVARLIPQLSINLDRRPVVDKTGLTGTYDFTLDWAQDNSPAAADGSVPMLFAALQKQLGLKLEPSRTMLDMLVIDSAQKPTED